MSSTLLFLLVALAGGVALAVQAGVNARLGRGLGDPVLAAFASFSVGTLTLGALLLARRMELPSLSTLTTVPTWAWVGGLLGAFFVTSVIVVAPRLGAGTLVAVVVGSQLATAVLLDHFGWLGFAERLLTWPRAVGVLMLVGGALLVRIG